MPYVGKKATNVVDVAESQSLTIDDNLTTPSINSSQIGGRRNLAYNGAMKISQRGTQTGQTGNSYTACDRFLTSEDGATVTTSTQETDVPSGQGFANSLEIDVTTADASVAASDTFLIIQRLEGQDLQHLLYGTSDAKEFTVSFWVKSPKTGTHILELRHNDATYFNSQAYTITSANTWQKVTKTFSGYTTTALDNDNAHSFSINWWLMAGSDKAGGTLNSNTWHNTPANRAVGQVNCVDNTANNFYLTGVQVEVGSVATEFEHQTFSEELALCQRYYKRLGAPRFGTTNFGYITGASVNANAGQGVVHHHPEMRANPSVEHTGTASDYKIKSQNSNKTCSSTPQFTSNSRQTTILWFTASGLLTSGLAVHLQNATTDGFVAFEAEL